MCGIFGWSYVRRSKIPAGQREVLASTLAVANSMRGDQSWGAWFLDHDGTEHVRREVGDIARVSGVASLGAFNTLFAHTRYATTGKITRDNQHPFRAGPILLAHNGMVHNHSELNRKYKRECAVDSQHFAYHLAEGLDFSDIEAYGAIEWIEAPSRTVNLCRMRNGQLTVYGIKDAKGRQVGCVWSSDAAHLRSAIGAARLDAFPYVKLEEGHVYTVHAGQLYTSERRLACAEPSWDPRAWATYKSTQGGGRRGYSFRDPDHEGISASLADWLARQAGGADEEGTTIQVDEGLFVDPETGRITDTLTGCEVSADEILDPCETCGSIAGYDENGDCKDCFTPSDAAISKRIADMTDTEFDRFQRVMERAD